MKYRPIFVVPLSALLSWASPCFGWDRAGHMLIAAAAYQELPAAVKRRADDALKAHAEYESWRIDFSEDGTGGDLGLYVFMRASAWPDEIRRKHSKYNHPEWHYVDYPLRAPAFKFEAAAIGRENILEAIERSRELVRDRRAAPEDRGVALAWLIHLIGDLHQPLHCGALFNETYPDGDRGGNLFFVKPANTGIPLHQFWDDLLGSSGSARRASNRASQLRSEHPWRWWTELGKGKTAYEWSLESRTLAVKKVYVRGKLKGATKVQQAPLLPSAYGKEAKRTAESQAILAAYRLADFIGAALKP